MKLTIADNLSWVCGDIEAVEKALTADLGKRLANAGVNTLLISEIDHPIPNGSGHYKIGLETCINGEEEILTTDTTNMIMIDEWRLDDDDLHQHNTHYTSLAEITAAYISIVLTHELL